MADEDVRKDNHEHVGFYVNRARSEEGVSDPGADPDILAYAVSESAAHRTAMVNVGGAIAYALLDLADAIREHGRSG